jgi:hypothetical protein
MSDPVVVEVDAVVASADTDAPLKDIQFVLLLCKYPVGAEVSAKFNDVVLSVAVATPA